MSRFKNFLSMHIGQREDKKHQHTEDKSALIGQPLVAAGIITHIQLVSVALSLPQILNVLR
jgi:hypothetical protein